MRSRIAILMLIALIGCRAEEPQHEAAMQQALTTARTAVARFRDDNGRGPHTLEELVPRYLTAVPADPVTGSPSTWRLTTEETVRPSTDFSSTETAAPPKPEIVEIHSGALGTDRGGKRWSDY